MSSYPIFTKLLLLSVSFGALCIGFPPWATSSSLAAETLLQRELDCLLEPRVTVKLGAAIPGLITDVLVDRGDVVKAGQVVAKLESSVEQSNVALARAKA